MSRCPTYIEVDLNQVRHNVKEIRRRIGSKVTLMLVVKADAYGHGASAVAKAALEAGAEQLGAAYVDEAAALREAGITCPILIVGLAFPEDIPDIVKYDIMPTVCDLDWARTLSHEAARQKKQVSVHVNVNTGMNRFGVAPEEAVGFIYRLCQIPYLTVEGVYTHLATAYSPDPRPVQQQFARFQGVLQALEAAGIYIPKRHCANTGALLYHPNVFLNMVRPGLLLTTPYPTRTAENTLDIRECLSMKSKVIFVRKVPAGEAVGYDGLYNCPRDTALAVVSAGWADGIPRELTNKGYVLIHGKRCPIRGRVMCDQIFADVTEVEEPVIPGDEAVILGRQGAEFLSGWEWREILGGVSSPVTLRSHRGSRVEVRYIGE